MLLALWRVASYDVRDLFTFSLRFYQPLENVFPRIGNSFKLFFSDHA